MDEQNRILNNIVGGPIIVPFPPRGVTEPEILDCGFGNHAWIDGLLADNEDWQVSIERRTPEARLRGVLRYQTDAARDGSSPVSTSSSASATIATKKTRT